MVAVELREAAARLPLLDVFSGHHTRLQYNIAVVQTAAEHARAALRVAAPLPGTAASAATQAHPSAQHQWRRCEDE